jgi:hypothetical protein
MPASNASSCTQCNVYMLHTCVTRRMDRYEPLVLLRGKQIPTATELGCLKLWRFIFLIISGKETLIVTSVTFSACGVENSIVQHRCESIGKEVASIKENTDMNT